MDVSSEHQELFVLLQEIISDISIILMAFYRFYQGRQRLRRCTQVLAMRTYSLKFKIKKQLEHMHDLVSFNDETCIDNLRMSRNAFGCLCYILANVGGLENTKNVAVCEQVAIFFAVLAHHKKNCIVKHDFKRSGYTISKHFNSVLSSLLKLHNLFLVKLTPIEDDTTNEWWKWYKGCLGALDGTYIPLRVSLKDRPRYRNRKGDVSVNVLVVCDINMNYVYMLGGWEGSAADSKVLKDAITRENGFIVPDGYYYLCDSGYTNGDGFSAPYRGVRYYIQEWNSHLTPPQNAHELFNKIHARACNVIERTLMAASSGRVRGGAANLCNGKSTRRCWTPDEEKVLVNALKDLLVRGYKEDNGFKSGYQMLLEQSMVQAFPGSNIRADLHINSRITVEIFGKDRATGEGAEDFADVVEEQVNTGHVNLGGKDNEFGGDYVPFYSNPQIDECQSMSFFNANQGGSSKSSNKRKRKVVDENDDRFINLMTSFCDKTNERLGDISQRIGFEHDASASRKTVFEELGDLGSSLDMEEMILVSHLIVNNTKNMDLFFSLSKDGRVDMVHMILAGKFPGMGGD
ncbi:hypothetical protein BUALT_Bualt06G0028700 [Buddleja alternifolia]|uniref:DDE Tnp4 domain-containing protein n=1 Tax=Buddleja alternifolia TaxID=168488 RepID=A0AAV6XCH3_9LAMI|nr:hypothetical protein BUALT_Bualt06G0028700 [Buddleja alternifolia]